MNTIKLTITFISLWLFLSASGQEKMQLTISEAQEYAVEHNKELENVRQDVNIAKHQYKEARGQGLPQINGTLDYSTNFNYEAELDFGGEQNTQPPDINYALLDPGDYEVLKFLEQMNSGGTSTIVMTDQSNAQVQLSQLIFGGQYWVGLQTARIGQELARQNVNVTQLDIKETVANTYQLILVTQKIVDVLEKNIDNLKEVKRHTNNMYVAGLAEQTDVDQISVSISQLKNKKKSMERNVNLSYNMLRFQMGLDSQKDIQLTSSVDEVLNGSENLEILSDNFKVNQNPNYQIVQTQEQLQKKQVDMQKWAFAPRLTGFYSYTEKIMTTGFDLSPKHAAGLSLNVPIFSSGTRKAKLEQAKIKLDKAQRSKELMKEQLQIQNNQLRYELTNAYDNYKTQQKNVKVARRVLENVQNKYKQGMVSSIELTQTNSNYLEAESNFLNATLELMQTKLKLKKLYNQL
ncbi:MAG: TolC family protein [Bacteroidales bacterium]|nr:TolC family protein [Bacteroidales bacterium]MCF8327986.1 TolC family protein [Bacteroidales bacterium]